MSTIGQYNLNQSMPKIQIGRESLTNNGIQKIVQPKTVGDKKTASQEDGSSNKAKRKTVSTTRKNKASTKKVDIIVNPFAKIIKSKFKIGTGKLKKKPSRKRMNKPKPKEPMKKNKKNDKTIKEKNSIHS